MDNDIEEIRKASRAIVREFGLLESKCAQIDISYAEGHALLEIEKYMTLSAGELALILNLNRSSTTRTLTRLKDKGWVKEVLSSNDSKKKPVSLTKKGIVKVREINDYSDLLVKRAFNYLEEEKKESVLAGVKAFARALKLARILDKFTIRRIQKKDNTAVKRIITKVSNEYQTDGAGGPVKDLELNIMFETYSKPDCAYYVVTEDQKVCGGAGIAPLSYGDKSICEFQKMYFQPHVRGQGLGEALMKQCIQKASELGYKKMYIETVTRMVQAIQLYEKLGARKISKPLGKTGHHQCECMMVIDL